MITLKLKKTSYPMNDLIKIQLELQKRFRERDFDSVTIVCGAVGAGKTTLAQQLADYSMPLSPNILDTFAFNMTQFKNLLDTKFKANVIMDESIYFMSSNSMKAENKELKVKLTQCRFRCLNIFMCLPNFWRIDREIVERACALVYVDLVNPDTEKIRGYYRYYPQKYLLRLYDFGKKTGKMIYKRYPETITGYFGNHWLVDKTEYERLKAKYTSDKEINKLLCTNCGSGSVRYAKKTGLKCLKCGFVISQPVTNPETLP